MVDHCGSGRGEACFAGWFAGWEKTVLSDATIPAAHEMPISHLASFIPATRDSSLGFIVDFGTGKQRHSEPARGRRGRPLRAKDADSQGSEDPRNLAISGPAKPVNVGINPLLP